MGVLEVKDLSLKLGDKQVLNGFNLDLWEGHVHALIGPNGAGKSTLANAVMGLATYTDVKGDILLEGESIKGLSVHERARKGITLAWQEPARFEGLSVEKFILAGARDQSRAKVSEVLDRVGLFPESYIGRAVDKTLSGGERKRIEVASILAMEPKIVLMDEPDSGIDVDALEKIFAALKDLKSEGATVLLITHSLAVLNESEHAFLVCNGRIVDKGSVDKISRYFKDKCMPCDHPNDPDPEAINE
ncbi:MAG: ABC transporter ATP-binding protein [bacterium]